VAERNGKKMKTKKALVAVCAAILIATLMVPAYAITKGFGGTTASSTYVTQKCLADNREYAANTSVSVNPEKSDGIDGSYVGANVHVYCKDYHVHNVPTGYMGGEPRLYLDGYLWFAEGWSYSDGVGTSFNNYYETYFVSREGIVYSKSKFGLYDGNVYKVYDTNSSPSIDVARIQPTNMMEEEHEVGIQPYLAVNENGQTYGMDYFDNYTPDLIAAIGSNGVRGYVYDDELTNVGLRKSINDVVNDIPTSIPLYDADGVTVIGEFPVGHRD